MSRNLPLLAGLCCGSWLIATGAMAAAPEMVWEVTGLEAPESAVFDEAKGIFYVSSVNGEPNATDGNGYLSTVSDDGKLIEKQWVTGLDAPKGLALHDGRLYVSDITKLVVVDTGSGEIVAQYGAAEAKFLNDVTVDQDGRVFVSDMVANTIYVLDGDSFGVWMQDAGLENPNGLMAEPDRLLVGAWGVMKEDFSTEVPGHLKAIDYDSKQITSLGGEPVGNLDGVEPDGKGGYLATDWLGGALYQISAEGKATQLMDLNQGSADHEFVETEQLVVIPMMMDGKLVAYKVE